MDTSILFPKPAFVPPAQTPAPAIPTAVASNPAPTSQVQPAQTYNGMDLSVVNLAQAIRKTESGGNYDAKGASGETGAYQWTPDTWKAHAEQILGDPNAPMTPANQNAVAYGVLKSWKDSGLNVAQIAAKWNSGSSDGWENKIGTNSQGVSYNVPQYVKSVTDTYQQIKAGNLDATPIPNSSTVNPDEGPSIGGFLGNVVKSAGDFASGLGNAIMHPIDTVTNLAKIAGGAVEAGANTVLGTNFDNSATQAFGGLTNYFGKRYGGNSLSEIVTNIGHTLYTDPVGAALDLSTFLDGVGGVVGKIGKLSDIAKATELSKASDLISSASGILKGGSPEAIDALRTNGTLTKVADAVKTVSDYVNPLNGAGKLFKGAVGAGGRIGGETLGLSTGAGYGAIKGAFNAGKEGGLAQTGFRSGISAGEAGQEALISSAQDAYQSIKNEQRATYQAQLENIKAGTHTLVSESLAPLYSKFDSLLKNFDVLKGSDGTLDFSNSRLASEPGSMTDIQQISKELDKYRNGVKDVNPANIDHLKQFISDRYTGGSRGSAFTTPLTDTVRTILNKNVPQYEKMTSTYAKTAGELKDFKQLSLGGKAGKETIIKKLTSAVRGNNDYRLALLKNLENKSGSNLISQAAGNALHSVIPDGLIQKYFVGSQALSSFIHPAFLLGLPLESPRLVGEFVNALGKGNRYLENIGNTLIKYKAPTILKTGIIANKSQN